MKKENVKKEAKKVNEVKVSKKTEKLAMINEKKAKKAEIKALVVENKKINKETKAKLKGVKDTEERKTIIEENKAVVLKNKQSIKTLKREKNMIGKKDTFLGDVMAEMRLVRWPKKEEMVKYSIACLLFILFFAVFFFGIDALFALIDAWFK